MLYFKCPVTVFFKYKTIYWNQPIKKVHELKPDYDKKKVQFFYEFVNICKKNDIPLFVVISPKFENCENCFLFSKEICMTADIRLHNFSSEKLIVSEMKNFEDPSHLNLDGAEKYSRFISERLKEFLSKKNNY